MEFIHLKEVVKEFKKTKILKNVNLTIQQGEILGIIGQSGSGKTTLLNLIAGFIEPTEGNVEYFSKINHQPKEMHKNLHKIKKHIGFTPQHASFYPKLTIKENLLHFGRLYGLKKDLLLDNANNLLKFTNLYGHQNKLAEHLSGGMQKRLDLSCSLIHNPKLLILDEPTADLDHITQREILELIQEVNKQGVTVVIASHHLNNLEKICDKIAIIHNGELKSFGAVEDVRRPYLKEKIIIQIKVGKDKDKVIEIAKKLPISKMVDKGDRIILHPLEDERALLALLKSIKEENLYLHDIILRKPSLNEVMGNIVEEEERK